MKTSDNWYTSIQSTESPIEQADEVSRSPLPKDGPVEQPRIVPRSPLSQNTVAAVPAGAHHGRRRLLPLFVAGTIISGLSFAGLIYFLIVQAPSETEQYPDYRGSLVEH